MENPRTDSARLHDDHAIIDAAADESIGTSASTQGNALAQDVASRAELSQIAEPDGTTSVDKGAKIDNDQSVETRGTPDG